MLRIRVVAVTAHTATLLIDENRALYRLDTMIEWSLNDGEQIGVSNTVPVFIDKLSPSTPYSVSACGERIRFHTLSCSGKLDATDFGVSVLADDNSTAFHNAIAAVPAGGCLYVPPGRYMSGPVFLKSDMTLLLCEGAEIAARGDRSSWPILASHDNSGRVVGTWEGLPAASFASPLTAIGCERLTITGKGIIDGGGDRGDWWTWPKETRDGARRPRTLFMAHCREVTVSGIEVRNSPSWTVHPFHCHDLSVVAVHIANPVNSPNTDGIDPESCTDVTLLGLKISVGDDCIAIKSGKRGTGADKRIDHIAPTRHLKIHNCLMLDGHGAVVMGSEMSGDITDVTVSRCEFKGTDRGLRIKTRRGRGGQVARIRFQDILMDGVGTALAINAFYFCDSDGKSKWVQSRKPHRVDEGTPHIHDIVIENVTVLNARHAVAAMLGLPEAPLGGVKMTDISVTYDNDAIPGEALMACHIPLVCHAGILHQFAQITVDDALKPRLEELTYVD